MNNTFENEKKEKPLKRILDRTLYKNTAAEM